MDERIRQLLIDYIRDRCSPQQLEEVYSILEKGGHEKEWEAALLATEKDSRLPQAGSPSLSGPAGEEIPVERLFHRISQSIGEGHADIAGPGHSKGRLSQIPTRRRVWMAAASVILLVATGISYSLFKSRNVPARMMEMVTGAGSRKMILLTDGSKIWLNNTSRIRYPQSFTGTSRNVYLEGEAFFDIAPDPAMPFHVHAGSLDVHVLGTSFDVRAYDSGKAMTVAVATGKVSVTPGTDHSSWQLLPGDRLVLDNGKGRLDRTDPALVQAWKDGILIFREERLGDICTELERWYGIKIRVSGESLRERRFTLRLQRESLQNVLEVIRLDAGIRYTYKDKEVIISMSK